MRGVDRPGSLCRMAPLRLIDPTGLYHVMSRGNYRRTIFPDDLYVARFTSLLSRVALRRHWIVVDWCAMPNHYHLLIQLTNAGLSEGMRELNGSFSRWSNAVNDRTGTGHLVRNRFRSRLVETETYLWTLLRYIPNNPVAAGLTDRPEDWPWSGYRATVGREHPRPFHRPSEILRQFDADPRRARAMYMRYLESSPVPPGLDLWSDQALSD